MGNTPPLSQSSPQPLRLRMIGLQEVPPDVHRRAMDAHTASLREAVSDQGIDPTKIKPAPQRHVPVHADESGRRYLLHTPPRHPAREAKADSAAAEAMAALLADRQATIGAGQYGAFFEQARRAQAAQQAAVASSVPPPRPLAIPLESTALAPRQGRASGFTPISSGASQRDDQSGLPVSGRLPAGAAMRRDGALPDRCVLPCGDTPGGNSAQGDLARGDSAPPGDDATPLAGVMRPKMFGDTGEALLAMAGPPDVESAAAKMAEIAAEKAHSLEPGSAVHRGISESLRLLATPVNGPQPSRS